MVSFCLALGNELHHPHQHLLIISPKCCYHKMDKTSSLAGLLLWKKKKQLTIIGLTDSKSLLVSPDPAEQCHISWQSFGWDVRLTPSIKILERTPPCCCAVKVFKIEVLDLSKHLKFCWFGWYEYHINEIQVNHCSIGKQSSSNKIGL